MFYPKIQEIKNLSKDYNMLPVSMEVYADMETPITIFKRFQDSKYCFLLESVEGGEKWARYSFIGRNPFLTMKSNKNSIIMEDNKGNITEKSGNPVDVLKNIMDGFKAASIPNIPRFNGGAVGFFGYDIVRFYENLPNMPKDDLELPECHFMFFDEILVFDHLKQKIHIIVNLHVNENIEEEYKNVTSRIKEIYEEIVNSRAKLSNKRITFEGKKESISDYKSNITYDEFCQNVIKAKEYIKDGDIFQVVLSQRFCVETKNSPFDVYRVLRVINPSPYMFYLKFDDYTLVGSSPEMLARVENGVVETCPIAGTRKRGSTALEDEELEKELLKDEKELSEHTMLVDLGRNDIGRISKPGTVVIESLMKVEKYSHVMHIVSLIKGKLRDDKTAFDALMSLLPAGTLSGAPKVRAMEIIDEFENVKRGPYGGAITYLSFNNNLDSCITIRTMIFKDGCAYVQSGAGIVADSIPENEYNETLNKAMALLKALEEAGDII